MYLDDFNTDIEIDVSDVVIEKERIMEFSKLYDPIPLHYDEEYAKTTRFGALIAPGVMSFMSVWSKVIVNEIFGNELIAGKTTKIEWFKPVYVGDILSGKARVLEIKRRNAYNGIVDVGLEAYNQHGELVLNAVVGIVMKYRG